MKLKEPISESCPRMLSDWHNGSGWCWWWSWHFNRKKNVPHLEMKAISFPPNWINQDSFLSFEQVFFHFGHWIGKDLTWKWFKMYGKTENFTSDNALRRRHLLRALNQKKWHSKITSQKLDSHSPRRTLCRFFLFDILPNNGWRA